MGPGGIQAHPRRWRSRWAIAILITSLAVLMVAGGNIYFPLRGTDRSHLGPGRIIDPDPRNASFLEDLRPADGLASNVSGGPWVLIGGEGLESLDAVPTLLDASGPSGCPLIPQPYASRSLVTFPASSDIKAGGLLPSWTFDFVGADGNGLRVQVVNGSAGELGRIMLTSPGCTPATGSGSSGTDPIDSSSAAVKALEFGGSTFLSAHPVSSVSYLLEAAPEPGIAPATALQWNVTYTACPPNWDGTLGSLGARLTMMIDAAEGTLEAYRSASFSCPMTAGGPIPYELPQVLSFNDPVEQFAGSTAYFNATVGLVCCGLTFGNLSILLGSASPSANPTLRAFDATGAALCVLSSSQLSGASGTGCSARVAPGELICVEVEALGTPPGDLAFVGLWHFQGRVLVPLQNATLVGADLGTS